MTTLVKAQDFFDQMRAANHSFRLLDANVGSDQAMLKGTFNRVKIRQGLTLHYSDVTNLCDLQTKTEAPPHLGIKVFFQGGVSASIGNLDIPMPVVLPGGRWRPSATFFHQQEPELFKRQAGMGDRVRKLTIKILPDWLDNGDVFAHSSAAALHNFTREPLAARSWTPTPTLLGLAEQIIRPPALQPHLARLYIESRVLGIISEAFGLLSGQEQGHQPADLTRLEHNRLRRAEELLRDLRDVPSLEEIAGQVGVSVNSLQRLFHAGHGTSVVNYIRTERLERARLALENDGVTVAQAAYLAGYNSAANFSTAFKRRYGFSPKQSRG